MWAPLVGIAPLATVMVVHGCSNTSARPPNTENVTESAADAGIAPSAGGSSSGALSNAATSSAPSGGTAAEGSAGGNPGLGANDGTAEKARTPQVVLHVGDSTVGYYGGLSKALEARFKAEGAQYVHDVWTSASLVNFDNSDKFKKLIARYNPDLVLITLGTNDVFIPSPQAFARHVVNIAKKTEGRECIWIGPPTWKKDTGIVEVIRQNSAPCKFFDSSLMKIQRRADGIHPTDQGGETWAAQFWEFYRPGGAQLAAPGFQPGGARLATPDFQRAGPVSLGPGDGGPDRVIAR